MFFLVEFSKRFAFSCKWLSVL